MVLSENEIYAIVTANNDILVADFSKLNLFEFITKQSTNISCDNISNTMKEINGKDYWVYCTRITSSDIVQPSEQLGTLISFSYYPWFMISPMILYFISSLLFGFFLTIIMLTYTLKKYILNPLLEFKNYIVSRSRTPLLANETTFNAVSASLEIQIIGDVFDKLLFDLQNEYQLRINATRNKALLDMAAQVAHDIRSPLAVMEISLANIQQNNIMAKIDMLKNAIMKIRDITNNLLIRYKQKDHPLDKTPDNQYFNLSTLLKSVIDLKHEEWVNNPCMITIDISPNARTCRIHASIISITRMLSNLLNNAYESLHTHREITIKLSTINHLLLSIKDSGVGIPSDKISAVLNGISLKQDGTGLGLSSAKYYIDSLGGELKIFSEVNKGTEVILKFKISETNI